MSTLLTSTPGQTPEFAGISHSVKNNGRTLGAGDERTSVLLVDDEEVIIEELAELLDDEGYRAISTTDPFDVMRLLEENPDISVVVSDIRMPGLDGLSLSRKIIETITDRDIGIIVLTGHAGMNEAIQALQVGIEDFLTKPVSADHLLHTVARVAELNRLRAQERDFKTRLEIEVINKTKEAWKLSHDLAQANEQLLLNNSQLESANKLKDEFLGMISHELNTPLNAVIGFSQMIASRFEKAGDGDGVELASLITTSGEHMHRNIQDILLMVSLQAKTFNPLEQNVTTIDLLQSVADRTKEQAETSNIKIKIDMAKDADVLIADAQMLARAVEVLVHNAILFSPNGGEVTLSAVNVGGKIQLSIRDHGPGMSDEKLTRALEMLTQGDGSLTRHHSGMGLGIPLAKGLTEAMGGIFEIKSGPQIGTEAILTFPSV